MFKSFIVISFLLLINTLAFAQDSNIYKNMDMGFEIQKPNTWKFEEQSSAPYVFFIKPPLEQEADKLYIFAVLVVASVPGMNSAEGFPTQREMIWKGALGDTYRKTKEGAVTIANEQGQSLFFQSEMGEKSAKWEEYYLVKNSTLYLLQFMAPLNLFDSYRKDFDLIFNSFKLVNASEKIEAVSNPPEEDIILDPSSNKVVFICNIDSASGEYLFLSTIPIAIKLNNGKPVIIATDGKLSESERHFLKRYSPGKAYLLGSENQGIKGEFIEQPNLLWDSAQTVIVSTKELTNAVMAAPLSAKLKCPLLFDNDRLDNEIKRLKPEHIVIVGNIDRDLSGLATKVTILKGALDVAGFFGKFDYVSVTNMYLDENKPERSYLLAPILAAYHNGVVYPICEELRFNFGILTEQIEEEGKKYLQGKISLSKSEVRVKVPIREAIKDLPPLFDDPYLDIGDGYKLTKIGDVKVIDGIEYAFSMRMIGGLGITKFQEYQNENRVHLLAPCADSIQKELLPFYAKTSTPKYVTIVGTPASIPFSYQRDPVYFDSIMQEMELATDNTYANTDDDDYLELSVGRIVNPDIYTGSINVAGIVTYDDMSGDWQKKALLIYPTSAKLEEEAHVPMVFSGFESLLKNMEYEMKHAGFEVTGQYREEATLDAVYPHLQGQALIVFAQHSDALRWSFLAGKETKHLVSRWNKTSEKLPSDINVLPYFNAPTLLIGLGCDSGGLDTGIEPGKEFLYGCFEKGAIGYIGNTRAGFPDTEEHAVKMMLNEIIYQKASIGEAFRDGKNYLLYIFKNRKPYQVSVFKDYTMAYGREFYQLVYYGDPAIKMKAPKTPVAATIKEQSMTENSSQITLLTIQPPEDIWQYDVMNMKEVGKGPIEYLKVFNAPELSYASTDWGNPNAATSQPSVLPGMFVKYEIPDSHSLLSVSLEEGPEWCYQGYNVETLEDGKTYLLSNVAIIKYLPSDEKCEVASKIVLKLVYR